MLAGEMTAGPELVAASTDPTELHDPHLDLGYGGRYALGEELSLAVPTGAGSGGNQRVRGGLGRAVGSLLSRRGR